jgi:transcriptional regulator of acetoin/glycerol metabolism
VDEAAPSWASIRAAGDAARRGAEVPAFRAALAANGWSLMQTAIALKVDRETLSRYLARRHPELCRERREMASRKA